MMQFLYDYVIYQGFICESVRRIDHTLLYDIQRQYRKHLENSTTGKSFSLDTQTRRQTYTDHASHLGRHMNIIIFRLMILFLFKTVIIKIKQMYNI